MGLVGVAFKWRMVEHEGWNLGGGTRRVQLGGVEPPGWHLKGGA